MASVCKRSWKLQEFVAHNASVNCLALGHKSGRVMVTGGDDKKVNLWAIGKTSCFMSLSGHTTPIECVQFNHVEELVCAGSKAGALKVWDLEAAKLVRTLTGHREAIRCIDFHPYGDFLASGSADCSIKIWDSRKKGCIYTYPGHKDKVNSIKFSPDGQWIASGGDDCSIKIWDMRIGKVLKEFSEHNNAVNCVVFHPHEFLLATGGTDRAVHFFDLENFNLVSSETDLGSVRSLWFNPDGECLFAGVRDYLKVVGWEPNRLYDSVPVNWGRICDISTTQNQLVGASFHLTNVMVYVADLKKIQPFGGPIPADSPCPFTPNQSIRKSFSRAERPVSLRNRNTLDVKTIEESTSGTDPEEESPADITNLTDYEEIFKAGRSLARTPPPEPEPFIEPEPSEPEYIGGFTEPQILADIGSESFEALSLDHNINYQQHTPSALTPQTYFRSKSNLDQVYSGMGPKQDRENMLPNKPKVQLAQKFNLHRQSSCKEGGEKPPKSNNIRHSVSEINLNRNSNQTKNNSRKNSFVKPARNMSNPNMSKIPMTSRNNERTSVPARPNHIINNAPVDIYVNPINNKLNDAVTPEEEFVPVSIDRPVGLHMDDFLPKTHQSFGNQTQSLNMSEAEVLNVIMSDHDSMLALLLARQRNLKIVLASHRNKDTKAAFETAVALNDHAIIVDLLGIINKQYNSWNLDMCVLLLPKLEDLLQSKYETYLTTACDSVKLVLKHFGPVIKANTQCPVGSFGVDIPREERYRKSVKCHENLENIRSLLLKKQTIPGNIGNTIKEIQIMMKNTLD